jgi:hypothetical protein
MARSLWLLFAAAVAFGASEDTWNKVKELKSGTEIRIVRRGVPRPIEAKLDETRDDAVVIVVKNEQISVPREDIDRLDYRPKPGSRIQKTGDAKEVPPDNTQPVGMDHHPPVPSTNYSSGLSIGSKPNYEPLYQRPTPAPKKQP